MPILNHVSRQLPVLDEAPSSPSICYVVSLRFSSRWVPSLKPVLERRLRHLVDQIRFQTKRAPTNVLNWVRKARPFVPRQQDSCQPGSVPGTLWGCLAQSTVSELSKGSCGSGVCHGMVDGTRQGSEARAMGKLVLKCLMFNYFNI